MFNSLVKKIFGSRNSRLLSEYKSFVTEINALEAKYQHLSQDELKEFTARLKTEYASTRNLDHLLTKAFALVREASVRTLGMRHYDEQILGGIALHFGKIAEMKTGEGKTLVSTLPAYLNSLSGESVFIITVNDYLARRDSEWMGKIYKYLGVTVGVITSDMDLSEKKNQYTKDIVYGTNNEFGFDYLRDNMVYSISDKVQGKLSYAIIDEVDSVLIDEARTPLIISGSASESTNLYQKINKLAQSFIKNNSKDDFYILDEKQKNVSLTEKGHAEIESLLLKNKYINDNDSLYNPKNIQLLQIFNSSLRANLIYQIDIDYVVENDAVVIIDEFSGRKMPGRRWAEGLHQSIEAKENVSIQNENQTYASITFQNYFRLFNKLSGMTGTADTEAQEFQQIYNLEVVVIPTHMQMIRSDHVDLIYLTSEEKYAAILESITRIHQKKQPVLVGTTSIEASEYLSKLLKKRGVTHSVLNAKHHQKEAEIIAEAGKLGAVTIATNMAGRGTDIVLGGKKQSHKIESNNSHEKDKVKNLGGLFIIGTERHESRRVDNQLRGRSGRQGDPGETKFFLSLEDNLMRIFASERVSEIMKKLGMQKGEAIEHKWVSKSIENAQKRVEAHNFDIRKTLLEYDDISNEQRKIIYNQRNQILSLSDFNETINAMTNEIAINIAKSHLSIDEVGDSRNLSQLIEFLNAEFLIGVDESSFTESSNHFEKIVEIIHKRILAKINNNMALINDSDSQELKRNIFLTVIDEDWRNHLSAMDYLRQSIGLRGYAQKNPKNEYKRESFEMFEEMLYTNNYEIIKILSRIKIKDSTSIENINQNNNLPRDNRTANNQDVPRNALCPCGSGKKYKRCCGRL